jgi:hypothetical protein
MTGQYVHWPLGLVSLISAYRGAAVVASRGRLPVNAGPDLCQQSLLLVDQVYRRDIPQAAIESVPVFAVRSRACFILVTGKADIVRRAQVDVPIDAMSTERTSDTWAKKPSALRFVRGLFNPGSLEQRRIFGALPTSLTCYLYV